MPDIISGLTGMLGLGGGGGAISRALGLQAPSIVMPAASSKPVMPIADDEAVQKARRRSLMRQTQRRGRASTILSGDGETLG